MRDGILVFIWPHGAAICLCHSTNIVLDAGGFPARFSAYKMTPTINRPAITAFAGGQGVTSANATSRESGQLKLSIARIRAETTKERAKNNECVKRRHKKHGVH